MAPVYWHIGLPDATAFLANYFAFRQLEIAQSRVDRALDWVEGVIAESRSGVVRLSSQPHASAFRAVRKLAEACMFFLPDRFRVSDFEGAFRKGVLSRHPEFSVTVRAGPFKFLECHPSLRGEDLVWALDAGFRGRPLSAKIAPTEWHAALSASVASSAAVRTAIRRVRAKPLATFLVGLADPGDLFLLQEELLLEFARAAVRLPQLIRQARKPAGQVIRGRRKPRHPSRDVDRRGQLAYKLVSDLSLSLKEALAKLQRAFADAGLQPVTTFNGMKDIAERYAIRRGIPLPPRRRGD